MNKQRVLVKHHAQLAEPAAVKNYFEAAARSVDDVLVQVVGKCLRDILVSENVSDPHTRLLIDGASQMIEHGNYLEALILARKALFLQVERDYDIKIFEADDNSAFFQGAFNKSPFYVRNPSWIRDHVESPLDYIQLDMDRVGMEMMELGIAPTEFFNVWRLTPRVYLTGDDQWAIEKIPGCPTEDDARYCVDVVTSIVLKKQIQKLLTKTRRSSIWTVRLRRTQNVLNCPAASSADLGTTLPAGEVCAGIRIVPGLDGEQYIQVISDLTKGENYFGYLPLSACEVEA